MKTRLLAAVAAIGLLLGTAGSTLATPTESFFSPLVTEAARSNEEGIPPNPVAPVTNGGLYVAFVATTFNPSSAPGDPTVTSE